MNHRRRNEKQGLFESMEDLHRNTDRRGENIARMFPIWASGIVFSAVYAQMSTMFVEQGMVMDITVGSFRIPPTSISTFDVISVLLWVPIYDRLLVPLARNFTGKEKGFSMLQRMGIGLFISMAAAAIVESERLKITASLDLTDQDVAVPLSIFWQIPQYFLIGAAEVFTFAGQIDFFYKESPVAMRSFGSALALTTAAEEAAAQAERERQRMLSIPGLVAPNEMQDEMLDS